MNAISYELYLKHGPTPGLVYPLTDKGLTIGRDPLSDILINDPEVSRQHALLSRTARGDYRIQDLGSTNGTYVDGRRLGSESIILQPSSTITMGGSVILIFRERSSGVKKMPDQAREQARLENMPRKAREGRRETKEGKGPHEPSEQAQIQSSQNDPSSLQQQKQVVYSSSEKIPGLNQIETPTTRELSPNLILGLVLLLLCSCASIMVFLIYLGGDWFFREIGLVP